MVCFVNGPLRWSSSNSKRFTRTSAPGSRVTRDYRDEHVIAHAFHHNAFLIVSNGHHARYGSITSAWEHFAEWKRLDERDQAAWTLKRLLNGMLDKTRLLDIIENFILFDASKPGATARSSP